MSSVHAAATEPTPHERHISALPVRPAGSKATWAGSRLEARGRKRAHIWSASSIMSRRHRPDQITNLELITKVVAAPRLIPSPTRSSLSLAIPDTICLSFSWEPHFLS